MKKIIILMVILTALTIGYFSYLHLKSKQPSLSIGGSISTSTATGMQTASTTDTENIGENYIRKGSNNFSESTLHIEHKNNNSFYFSIDTFSGGHVGGIDGVADMNGDTAIFKDKEDSEHICELYFTFKGNTVSIGDNESNCSFLYAGVGVYFDGVYSKDVTTKVLSIERFFENKRDFELLKKTVGSSIKLFENSAGTSFVGDEVAESNTKVKTFGVSGLFTALESIVMISPDGKIFTAVIDPEKDIVLYFTNVLEYKNKLPESIEDWRLNFKDKKVIFNFVKI